MLVKLVDKKTRVATLIPIADDSQIEFGDGFIRIDDEGNKVKIVSIDEAVLCLPDKVFSEIKEGDLMKFFAEYKDVECLCEIGIEAFGPMMKSIAFSAKEYDGYILENGKTVDRI